MLKIHIFRPFLCVWVVSEIEIRTLPWIAFGDVHLAGPQSMPCFRSRDAVETAFQDLQIDRAY